MPETASTLASPLENLKKLGITLPAAPKPVASYVNAVRTGNLLFVAGQIPMKDGKPAWTGKVGREVTVDQAKQVARHCVLQALAIIHETVGLDKVRRVVRTVGHVACAPGFTDVHVVNNGASDFLVEVFGERGKHARLSLGAGELPLNVPFEFEIICEVA